MKNFRTNAGGFIPLIVLLLTLIVVVSPGTGHADERLDFFESKVRPVLVEHCYECHSAQSGESEGELRLDTLTASQRGGIRGPAIVPGDPDASLLIRAIGYADDDMQMPPQGQLDPAIIADLTRWVADGAVDPREDSREDSRAMADGDHDAESMSPMQRDPRSHWTFMPPRRIDVSTWQGFRDHPEFSSTADAHDVVDHLARMRAADAGLVPNPPADRETLIRRLAFDLTGLPPTRADVDAFIADEHPRATGTVIDRFLADPRFAERFARHWLDVARYADTVGYALAGKERRLLGSHLYRDWVVAAFAQDMPLDEMIRHQLAGDRTDPTGEHGNVDAMGFLTIGRRFLNPHDTIDDRIDVVSRGLLGLTVACARCHDHKFDPIPTVDYYSLYNVLNNSIPPPESHPASGVSPLMLVDRDAMKPTRVFVRGNPGNRGDKAPRRYLTSLRQDDEPEFSNGSGRLELAQRIADVGNPLTARVFVNRVWGHLMGRHLVDSPSDFGFRTRPPAIAELLDDLAVDFQADWSVKRLVRRIVSTRIYQQSSAITQDQINADPGNGLWTRTEKRRRDFESMRDSMLFRAGSLDSSIGGPSVDITGSVPSPRRTLYALIDRQNLPQLFRVFDFASPDMHTPSRSFTTVPQQALFLVNDPQTNELARRASAAATKNAQTDGDRVTAMFRHVLARDPSREESRDAIAFVADPAEPPPVIVDPRSLWQYGVATLADNQLTDFVPFDVFENDRWQFQDMIRQDGPRRYLHLDRRGGHPAMGDGGAVVRRWTSPADGRLKMTSVVGHEKDAGDGVIAVIRVGGKTVWRETQFANLRPIESMTFAISAGQFVDFVVHSGPTLSHDSFFWESTLSLATDDGGTVEADSKSDFSGPYAAETNVGLDRWAQLAQVLLLTDEFAFVD